MSYKKGSLVNHPSENASRFEKGQGLVEYAFVLTVIAVVVIVFVLIFGSFLKGLSNTNTYTLSRPSDICVIDGKQQILSVNDLQMSYIRNDGAIVSLKWVVGFSNAPSPVSVTVWPGNDCPR